VFAREWMAIGDTSQLAVDGDTLALSVAGFPIIVVNDLGTLRGFHNVCRHRAGPLVADGRSQCTSFVCRYHGWSYNRDGSLKAARDFGEAVRSEDFSLHPIAVADFRGILLICLSPDPKPLTEWLATVEREASRFPIESFVVTHRSQHEIAADWKVYAENYQEGYHIPLVHPGLNRQIVAKRYEVRIDGPVAVYRAPTRAGSVTDGVWLWRFPGLALNIYPTGMSLESFWPTGPKTTLVSYTFFFHPATPEDQQTAAIASSIQILEEDRDICEAVQRNLSAGIYDTGILSPRHERGVELVQRLVAEALARDEAGALRS